MDFFKKFNIKHTRVFLFLIFSFFLYNNFMNCSLYAADALKTDDQNAIITVLCNITKELTGGIAKGVAIIAIVVVAVGLFMGKFSWGVGLATALGIAMIFGASTVVEWLAAGIATGQKFQGQINNFC
jgi:type IV secretory pathway VirB2 component (pilin)